MSPLNTSQYRPNPIGLSGWRHHPRTLAPNVPPGYPIAPAMSGALDATLWAQWFWPFPMKQAFTSPVFRRRHY